MNFPLRKEEAARIDSKRFAAEPAPISAFATLEDAQTEAYAEGRKDQREEDAKREAIEDLISALPLTKENLVWLCKRLDVMANRFEFDWLDNIDEVRVRSIGAFMAAEGTK